MRVNARGVLGLLGSAAILKQKSDGAGALKKRIRGRPTGARIVTASSAVLAAGCGLFYLFRRGQRRSQAAFGSGLSTSMEVEAPVVAEELDAGLTPPAASGNGQEAAFDRPPDDAGSPEAGANADPAAGSEGTGAHRGGDSGIIASPEAVVDPGAAPEPIVSPEPALPQQTGVDDSEGGGDQESNP